MSADGPTEASFVEEALALRWGRELGDAFRNLWEASETISAAEAEELLQAEVYEPRQERRRQAR